MHVLAEARTPCAHVLDVGHAFYHPHIYARDMIDEVKYPVFGRMEITNTPFVFSEIQQGMVSRPFLTPQ